MKNSRLKDYPIRKIAIFIFCIIIGICVSVIMFSMYKPNQNSLAALASVCMDVICMIILFVLISSFAFNHYDSKRTTSWFAVLLVASIWALFLDFLNWAFDGSLEFGHLTFWFTLGSLCMGSILACIFMMYLYSYMAETHKLGRMIKIAKRCVILNLFSLGVTFILAITGTAFQFVNGHYELGVLYDVVTVVPVLSLLYSTAYIIRYVKRIGVHDVFAVVGYILFMIAGALIEASYGIGTTYVAVAIADIFIFVMLQNEIIAQEKRNVQKWMKKSKTDELTGLYNRYAFELDMKRLEELHRDEDFVVVSVDVNSLKATNDSLGHNAGDELLIGAAECLEKCFGAYGNLYRTGGDEFYAFIYADKTQLKELKRDLESVVKKWKGKLVSGLTLSSGYVEQKENKKMTVKQMTEIADQRMYEAKNEFYRQAGIDRRKK